VINALERLAILIVAVVSVVFVYGMLSMAWAGCTSEKQPDCAPEEAGWGRHGDPVTLYAPAVFSNSLAMWKLLDSQVYVTPEDCRATLPPDRDAQCIALTGELPPN
jgi:hypothetical protein